MYFLDGVSKEEKIFRGKSRSQFLESINASKSGAEISAEELLVLLSDFHIDWLKLVAIKKGSAHPKFDEVEIARGVASPSVDCMLEIFDTYPTTVYVREDGLLAEVIKRYPDHAPVAIDLDCHPVWG